MHKSFADITLPITEEEYRNDGNLHYSTLATYDREGFEAIAKLDEKKESPSLLYGSIVDVMLTGTREEFDRQYIIADFAPLKPAHASIAKALFDKYHIQYPKLSKMPDSVILEMANSIEFGKNWRDSTRIQSVRTECEEYYNLMSVSEGKTVIDTELYESAVRAVKALRESEATKWYFAKDNPFDGIERVYQAKFKAEFDGIMYSAMADLVVIDHEKKLIYPCDLKTSGHKEYEFCESFLHWRYFVQANQYAAIIKANIDKDDYFKDFKIMPYTFIVVNKESLTPLTWTYPYTFSDVTMTIKNQKGEVHVLRNFREIGKELKHYLDTKQTLPDGISATKPNNIVEWIEKGR